MLFYSFRPTSMNIVNHILMFLGDYIRSDTPLPPAADECVIAVFCFYVRTLLFGDTHTMNSLRRHVQSHTVAAEKLGFRSQKERNCWFDT